MSTLLLLITLPIVLIDTLMIYYLMSKANVRNLVADRQRMLYSSLIRFCFATQLVIELCTGNKTLGGICSFGLGLSAGLLTTDGFSLNIIADTLMNVFMGISMGIFLIGHLPHGLVLLLIAPVFLSSVLTFLHTRVQMRKESEM